MLSSEPLVHNPYSLTDNVVFASLLQRAKGVTQKNYSDA